MGREDDWEGKGSDIAGARQRTEDSVRCAMDKAPPLSSLHALFLAFVQLAFFQGGYLVLTSEKARLGAAGRREEKQHV